MAVTISARDRVLLVLCVCCFVALAAGESSARGPITATLFVTAGTRRFRGVGGLLTGIVAGALIGAGAGYAAVALLGAPLSLAGAVGLGVALGGGLGVVTNYLVTGEEVAVDETMTVERDPRQTEPTPADLFDDHPDPILYVADEGHGPVVRAANAAYGETFDVPTDAVANAPLEEAVLAGAATETVVEAVAGDGRLDEIVTCETADGQRQFRIRSTGPGDDGYLVYTPVEN